MTFSSSAMIWALGIQSITGVTVPSPAQKVEIMQNTIIVHTQELDRKVELVKSNPLLYLYWYGRSQGLVEWQLRQLEAIGWCESRWRTGIVKNPVSSASGIFQIVHDTWISNSAYSWDQRYEYIPNIETAVTLYKRRGAQPWASCLTKR